jgi:hypothetical protein
MSAILPPRKRDWKKGIPQVGVFIRTETGGTIAIAVNRATERETLLAYCMFHAARLPESLFTILRLEYDALIEALRREAKKATMNEKKTRQVFKRILRTVRLDSLRSRCALECGHEEWIFTRHRMPKRTFCWMCTALKGHP